MTYKHTNTHSLDVIYSIQRCDVHICELALTLNLVFFAVCETDSLLAHRFAFKCVCVGVSMDWTERESKRQIIAPLLHSTHTSISISSIASEFSDFLSLSPFLSLALFLFFFTFNFDVLSSSWWSSLLLTNSKISDFRVQPSVCSGGFFVRCFVDALSIYRRRWAWKATAAWYRFPHQIRGARQRTIDTGVNELEQSASKQSK